MKAGLIIKLKDGRTFRTTPNLVQILTGTDSCEGRYFNKWVAEGRCDLEKAHNQNPLFPDFCGDRQVLDSLCQGGVMSVQQIIKDLHEIGETEAAMKILLMEGGLRERPESYKSTKATTVSDLFVWDETPEGINYWAAVDDKLNYHRNRRRKDEDHQTL